MGQGGVAWGESGTGRGSMGGVGQGGVAWGESGTGRGSMGGEWDREG